MTIQGEGQTVHSIPEPNHQANHTWAEPTPNENLVQGFLRTTDCRFTQTKEVPKHVLRSMM